MKEGNCARGTMGMPLDEVVGGKKGSLMPVHETYAGIEIVT